VALPSGPSLVSARQHASSVSAQAGRAENKRSFRRLARLGLGARAVIYVLLSYFAADIALTRTAPANASGSGAIAEVGRQPGGRFLLGVLAVGLAGYALWRLVQAVGPQDRERGAEAVGKRVGLGAVAVVYVGLCARAVSSMTSLGAGGGGGGATSHPRPVVASVLRWPAGPVWVGLAGAALGLAGLGLAVWGAAHDYRDTFDVTRTGRLRFRLARAAGTLGDAARGLLVVLVSAYLFAAAQRDDPGQAKSLDGALRAFARVPIGPPLLLAAAAGLACFAAYSALEAAYRDV
jgi:Domain of Unknown Function (DUF1206)